MNISIDNNSGCCPGVVRAIEQAEKELATSPSLFSLGAIVHNNTELKRLEQKGLKVVDHKDLLSLKECKLLIRAHGEPPSTYRLAKKNGIEIIDCTCPVVLKLQKKIKKIYGEIKREGGQVVIFGKKGHAEVNGLTGQVDGDALVVENIEDIKRGISTGTLDTSKPIALFSQTTKAPEEYSQIGDFLKTTMESSNLRLFNTICGQVSSRHSDLSTFAKTHSIIIFVSGKESSNGKVLFNLCKSVNPRSYTIENSGDIRKEWFNEFDSVGICGATSTPKWQLEEVASFLTKL